MREECGGSAGGVREECGGSAGGVRGECGGSAGGPHTAGTAPPGKTTILPLSVRPQSSASSFLLGPSTSTQKRRPTWPRRSSAMRSDALRTAGVE